MENLSPAFKHDGFQFVQLDRNGQIAILRKSKPDRHHFEVLVIQQEQEFKTPDKRIIPAHERMPRNEEWGTHGWTCRDFNRAVEKLNELVSIRDRAKRRPAGADESLNRHSTAATNENLAA